jgi:predicted nucleic acid-binding protein
MTFVNLAPGESIFVDANTFVYHFAPDPMFGPSCGQLIQRIDSQDLHGYTSTHILSEIAHRLMTIEASTLFGWPFQGIAYRLQKHPAQLQKLSAFRQAVETVLNSKMQVLSISPPLVLTATTLSQQTGLLSNDALIAAVMQANGLNNIASNDADFDRVPGIKRYAPV